MDILLILLAVFGLSFFIAYIHTAKQLKTTTQHLAESILLYLASAESNNHNNNYGKEENDKAHSDSFIKFLSDSRDWAFNYIEEVQNGLKDFIEKIEPEVSYYKKYGASVEGMIPPHDIALKKLSAELDTLKKLLPQDPDDRR